jgi:hypothetical protein
MALLLALTLSACGGGTVATDAPASAGTPAPSTPLPSLRTPEPGASWPPAWGDAICMAWAQLQRADAAAGGTPGTDAATRALEVMKKAGAWPPGAAFRSALGRDAFTLLDASPRGGQALSDRGLTLRAAESAYLELNAATGFSCPD